MMDEFSYQKDNQESMYEKLARKNIELQNDNNDLKEMYEKQRKEHEKLYIGYKN